MTEVQIRNIITGYLGVLRNHDDAYDDWARIAASGNYDAIGALLAQTMSLATKPTKADIEAMDAYLEDNLPEDKELLAESRPGMNASMTICGECGEG